MNDKKPNITVNVDVTNPGQFFACCGLLELADRLWPGAEGWFETSQFCIAPLDGQTRTLTSLLQPLINCSANTERELAELHSNASPMVVNETENSDDSGQEDSKKPKTDPILLGAPIDIQLDWWLTDGSENLFKTWQQMRHPNRCSANGDPS